MKNTFGNNLCVTLFGESHGNSIGAVLDGIAPGIPVDTQNIAKMLEMRKGLNAISTPRREPDKFEIVSGVFEGKTTGTPLCIIIKNEDTRSADYSLTKDLARPSHADYTANQKYHGFEDYRGGGHFSARITAPLVALGAIIKPALEQKGIFVGSHILKAAHLSDREFGDIKTDLDLLKTKEFAVLDDETGEKMIEQIKTAKSKGDSIGGVLETAVIGCPAGVGEPWFDSVESMLSHAIFSIPAVKGVEFGLGFKFGDSKGSIANDCFINQNGKIVTKTNNSGGINGGITNGMPIVFKTAFRPTPTIAKPQNTINIKTGENTIIEAKGRHDPFVVHRAKVVVDSVTSLVMADLLTTRYGTDWLGEK
ncbi:MAG: chorismate synthase [Ruminococcaceae bacterium]|nr:chorismate synthase [Oscillospiraceae bacterium]